LASPPPSDQAFLREVDEELRREQLATAWRRWGLWLVVAIVAALVAFAGWLWWNQHEQQKLGEAGEKFTAAFKDLGEQKLDAAKPALAELAQSGSAGFRASAKFTEADILLQKNDLKGAAAKFAELAGDASLPKPFRDLALIRQTYAEYDTLAPQAVTTRLGPIAVKESAWFGSAGEMVAIAYLRMGRRDAAGKLYGEIARTESVPASIRQRAVQMAGVLGVDAVDQSEEKKFR
jgi:hypothetical protein